MSMITIATERLSRGGISEVSLKAPLTLFLSVLDDIIAEAMEDASITALASIGKLSRIHGKAELALFEPMVQTIVRNGVPNGNANVKTAAIRCLHSMM